MHEKLTHTAKLIGYRKTARSSGLQEIAVYSDGMVKKIDLNCAGHYREWRHPDPEAFLRFNQLIERV